MAAETSHIEHSTPNAQSKTEQRNGWVVVGLGSFSRVLRTWPFQTLEEARRAAKEMAGRIDAEFDVYQLIGTMRQVRPEGKRPVEWIEVNRRDAETQRKSEEPGTLCVSASLR